MVTTDAKKLLAAQVKRFAKVKITMEQGHTDLAKAGRDDLFELTSGTKTKRDLRKAGHPYARGQWTGRGARTNRASGWAAPARDLPAQGSHEQGAGL